MGPWGFMIQRKYRRLRFHHDHLELVGKMECSRLLQEWHQQEKPALQGSKQRISFLIYSLVNGRIAGTEARNVAAVAAIIFHVIGWP
jgi:hypothetical protein